jgi:phosphate butyryltransferase
VKRNTGRKTKTVHFDDILKLARKAAKQHKPKVAVAGAHAPIVLDVLCDAAKQGFAEPVLFGDEAAIRKISTEGGLDLAGCDIVDVKDPTSAARRAADMAHAGDADVLMKGNVTTATIMKAALDDEIGIKTDRLMSHVAVFEVKGYDRVMFMSDGGIVIEPDLAQKVEIVRNAIGVAHALGVTKPRVALLSAIEIVNTKMRSAVDAAVIAKMADRGQIKGAVVDGPFGLDNAISPKAAEQKGVRSPVAGRADILIVGHADVGNVLYKSLSYFVGDKCSMAGVIVGAKVPMVVVSRADTYQARLNSIAIACVLGRCR